MDGILIAVMDGLLLVLPSRRPLWTDTHPIDVTSQMIGSRPQLSHVRDKLLHTDDRYRKSVSVSSDFTALCKSCFIIIYYEGFRHEAETSIKSMLFWLC